MVASSHPHYLAGRPAAPNHDPEFTEKHGGNVIADRPETGVLVVRGAAAVGR